MIFIVFQQPAIQFVVGDKIKWTKSNILYYRPHPKDDGRLYFQSVHTWGGGSPGPGRGGTRSQITGGVPSLRSGGVPSLRSGGGGYPVSVKGKIFDTRFGLIHVQTGKKKFLLRDPPPPSPWNSKDLLWLRGGRYASCVHAGGLSCCL